MARRGRFTSPNSGGQNLTALITALLRERNDAEEQALLNAYRTGTPYNGSVPTADDIQAFYDNWASSSGYATGSLEYQAIVQKKSELNNYDIKKQYNSLLSTFNANNGANYDELLDFLGNRAVDSTDPQDLESYASAVSDINKSYIAYQGEALGRGEITAAEYRNLTNDIVSQMDPSDPKRYETLVNSYTYEWNAEKAKWDNRLTAGTVTAGQYSNWAKGFQTALLAAGVKKDSVLYTTAVAAQAIAQNRGGGGSGSVVKTRIDGTLKEIDDIVDVALSLNPGGKPRSVSEIFASGKDSLKALTDDPALILNLGEALDRNPAGFPALAALGITDSASLNIYFQGKLESGRADANLLVSSGGPDYTDSWYNTSNAVGALSEISKFDFQSTKWLKDIGEAQGNVAKIESLNREWETYLSGGKSKYGSLDALNLPPQFLTLAQNEFDAMTGQSDGSLPTLSGTVNSNIPLDFTTIKTNKENLVAMRSGEGYQQWSEKNQEFEFASGRPAGRTETGSYQFVEFAKVNGEIISYVTSIQGTKVSDKDGIQIGWVYDPKNGSAPIISNLKGQLIDTPEAGLNGDVRTGFVLPDGASFNQSDGTIPLYNTIGLATKTPVSFGENNRNELALIRSGISQEEYSISPDDLREASGLVANVLPALGGNIMAGGNIANDILSDANKIQITQISGAQSGTTPKGRAEIARLSGNTDLEKAWLFIDANKDKLEVVNGGYQWKAGTAEATQPRSDALGQAAAFGAAGFAAGGFTGIGAIPSAIGAGVVGFAQGLAQGKQSPLDTINDINKTILNQDPSMKTQREKFYYSMPNLAPNAGAQTPAIGDRFFRKINAPAIPTTPGVRPGIPDLSVSIPKPAIPAPVVPVINQMSQKYGSGAFQTTTPIAQNQSTERRGGK
jgi:hypothetical protein